MQLFLKEGGNDLAVRLLHDRAKVPPRPGLDFMNLHFDRKDFWKSFQPGTDVMVF
jgi:hypothetical protein